MTARVWRERRVEPALNDTHTVPNYEMPNTSTVQQLTCTSTTFCFGVGTADVLASSDPSGGVRAWRRSPLASDDLSTSSCAGTHLCVLAAVEPGGSNPTIASVSVSSNPSAAAPLWHTVAVPTAGLECEPDDADPYACQSGLLGLSCPSTQLCVAIDGTGQVLTATDPGNSASWRATQVLGPDTDPLGGYGSGLISCPTRNFCAIWENGKILTSTHPTGGVGSWHSTALSRSQLIQLDCASTGLCVAIDNTGDIVYSTDPTSRTPHWAQRFIAAATGSLTETGPILNYSISCPTARECFLLDPAGRVITGELTTGTHR